MASRQSALTPMASASSFAKREMETAVRVEGLGFWRGIMEKTEATISIGIMEKKMEAEPKSNFPKRALGFRAPN